MRLNEAADKCGTIPRAFFTGAIIAQLMMQPNLAADTP
jgi:hypothetical protein